MKLADIYTMIHFMKEAAIGVCGYWDQMYLLPLRKQDNKQVHSQVLQDVLLRLDKAYQAFFKKLAKYPRFKRKEKCELPTS
ncbi:putative transposase, IS605 OrfB family [Candidatus Nitrososphaera gargensis Ga9.2]|uniref:Putative transposase, IS605 OrfB family n=1 Tax=Nitrososphaera gargensis (strain Ga9.2) TaxID=1237085 RepID=K0I8B1_NITGG|nr:putative transposase, IS605 OrfB family [Candidatus Nitrososphaera gargensis Ga9.2]